MAVSPGCLESIQAYLVEDSITALLVKSCPEKRSVRLDLMLLSVAETTVDNLSRGFSRGCLISVFGLS